MLRGWRSEAGRRLLRGTLGLLLGDVAGPPFASEETGEGLPLAAGWPLQTTVLPAPASSPARWGEASSVPWRLEGALGAPAGPGAL